MVDRQLQLPLGLRTQTSSGIGDRVVDEDPALKSYQARGCVVDRIVFGGRNEVEFTRLFEFLLRRISVGKNNTAQKYSVRTKEIQILSLIHPDRDRCRSSANRGDGSNLETRACVGEVT